MEGKKKKTNVQMCLKDSQHELQMDFIIFNQQKFSKNAFYGQLMYF